LFFCLFSQMCYFLISPKQFVQSERFLPMKLLCAVLCLAVMISLAACGGGGDGGGDGTNPPPRAPNVSGNWQFYASSNVTAGNDFEIYGYVNSSGNTVTARVRTPFDCFQISDILSFTGTYSNGQITLTSVPISGQTVTIQGQLTASNVMGSYSISGGCADGDRGALTGFKVPSFSGNWAGTFTSDFQGTPGTTQVAAAFTQGGEDLDLLGLAELRGTATFTGTSCTYPVTIGDGAIVYGVHFRSVIITSEGVTIRFDGTANELITEITGTYRFSGGACSQETGTGTLTRQ
jgi:hypothetical protein